MRTRRDRCPGVLRPWPAADGGLARVRVPGGQLPVPALRALHTLAQRYGDGRVHLTGRANLQLRALPLAADGALPEEVVVAIEETGLLPRRSHDLARNILTSPCTGLAGGRADLRPVTAALDAALIAVPELGGLPGRFLFTLDDGRGDLAARHLDVGLVALDAERAQLRVGAAWGEVVALADAPAAMTALAARFLARRGDGPSAAWHVAELAGPLAPALPAEPGADVVGDPLPFGAVPGGHHVPALDVAALDVAVLDDAAPGRGSVVDVATVLELAEAHAAGVVVLTPFAGVLLPARDGTATASTATALEER